MEIRRAQEADFQQLLPLLAELLEERMGSIEEMRQVFLNDLQHDKRAIFVADDGGMVKGLITMTVYKKGAFYANCIKAEIDEFIVSGDVRGGGVAASLMERAVQHAAEKGCRLMELWSRLGNDRAHAFYEKAGFIKQAVFFQRKM